METKQKRRSDALEACFKRFPDIPKEVLVKEDLLRLGSNFSPAAVKAAEGCRTKSYYCFAWDQVDEQRVGAQEVRQKVPEDFRISGGMYDLKPTVVCTRVNTDSPYVIDVVEGRLALCENGVVVADVLCDPEPKYYSKVFEDGTLYSQLAPTLFNAFTVFVNPFRHCQHWDAGEECRYCDIGATVRLRQKLGKKTGKISDVVSDPAQVAEAVAAAFSEKHDDPRLQPKAINISGGAITHGLQGMDELTFYLRYVRAIREKIGYRVPICLVIESKNKDDMKKVKEAGVTSFTADYEIWDKRIFEAICPGKTRVIGRDNWIRWIVDSVEVMGEGNVYPCFVAGVELSKPYGFETVDQAIKSNIEGFEFFMSHGVIPKPITWVVAKGSALAGHEPAPLEYYARLLSAWYECWKKYRLPPFTGYGPMGPGRAVYMISACNDMGDPYP